MSKHRIHKNRAVWRPRNTWLDEQAQRVRDAWPRLVLVPWEGRYESAAQAVNSVRSGLTCRLRVPLRVDAVGGNLRVFCADMRRRPEEAWGPRPVEVQP